MRWIFYRGFSLFFVITLTFFSLRVMPGDAIEAQMMQSGVSESVIDERKELLGLDRPVFEQYTVYLTHLAAGDWGVSLYSGQSVLEILRINMFSTLVIVIPSLVLACLWGITAGVCIGLNFQSRSPFFLLLRTITLLAIGMPIYWSATLAVLVFSLTLFWFPSSGTGSLEHIILPVGVLAFHVGGALARITEAHITDIRREDFVRTAYAKGLGDFRVNVFHVLRIGMIPLLSAITLQAGFLISGTIITETVFVRPGLGRVLLDATLKRDYPVIQGVVIISAVFYILLNSIADILYPFVDPRVRNLS